MIKNSIFNDMSEEMSFFIKTYEETNEISDRQESINFYFIYKIQNLQSEIIKLKEKQ